MPELPEVETIRRDLSKLILGKTIVKVVLYKHKMVKSPARGFAKVLTGNKIKKLSRRGKLLIAELATGGWVLIHLKMTGQLIYRRGKILVAGGHAFPDLPPTPFPRNTRDRLLVKEGIKNSPPLPEGGLGGRERQLGLPNKHTHVVLEFSDGGKLFFNDLRQFGYMKLVDKDGLKKALASFGIEPLSPSFTLRAFAGSLKGKQAPIKAVLLNQKHIAGIGNIYADEVCFLAGILPAKRAHRLTASEIAKLHKDCRTIIKKAVEKRGTTFRDYRDPDGQKGNFVKYLKVYGRGGEKCLRCRTSTLKKSRIAGRGTVYCVVCQK